MTASKIRTMKPGEEDAAIGTIVLAFAADPMTRWSWPGANDYLAAMPRLSRAFGSKAFASGSAYCIDGYAGVALWLPPGVKPDEDGLDEIIRSTFAPSQLKHAPAIFEAMAKYHPREPHWYLPLIAVDPVCQGKGYGNTLMTHALERCDRDHAPAYLESSNPRNIPLYRRHGFEPLGEIQVGSSPPVVPMLRR
jgi:ribosomal protein S18 acetylase RimI-like enzyme